MNRFSYTKISHDLKKNMEKTHNKTDKQFISALYKEFFQINKKNTRNSKDKQAKNINNILKKKAVSILKYEKMRKTVVYQVFCQVFYIPLAHQMH